MRVLSQGQGWAMRFPMANTLVGGQDTNAAELMDLTLSCKGLRDLPKIKNEQQSPSKSPQIQYG